MDTFFTIASPTTLASFIADIDAYDPTIPGQAGLLRATMTRARVALEVNVGVKEASRMIASASGRLAAVCHTR